MIRLAIIGAGNIAKEHLNVICSIKEFKVISITSRTTQKAKILAKNYKIKKIYESIDTMLKVEKLDAVAVFVSAENMFEVLKKIIKYKITFFFEKPAALNFRQTMELHRLVKKYKVKNMVGLNRRFYSVFHKGVKFLNQKGGLKGLLVEGHERFWKIKSQNKFVYDNWVYANSIHTLDLLRFFGGDIKHYKSFSYNEKKFKNFTISLKFKNKMVGTYISNWHSPGGWTATLFGKLYTIVFKPLEKGYIINHRFKTKKILPNQFDLKFKPGFYNQMLYFKNLVKYGRLEFPAQSLNDLLKTIKLINTI